MVDVSIPVNNEKVDQNINKPTTIWDKIKRTIAFISIFLIWLSVNTLLVFTFGWIDIDSRTQALVIEICSQVISAIITIFLLSTFHQRIIVFVTAIHLLILKRRIYDEESAQKYCDNKHQIIKKYINWYNEHEDSLSFVLLVTVLRIIDTSCTLILTAIMVIYSGYDKNRKIIIRMISAKPRPSLLSSILVGVATASIIIAIILVGYKLYKKKILTKETVTKAFRKKFGINRLIVS